MTTPFTTRIEALQAEVAKNPYPAAKYARIQLRWLRGEESAWLTCHKTDSTDTLPLEEDLG